MPRHYEYCCCDSSKRTTACQTAYTAYSRRNLYEAAQLRHITRVFALQHTDEDGKMKISHPEIVVPKDFLGVGKFLTRLGFHLSLVF
jgi:hypothetical protein